MNKLAQRLLTFFIGIPLVVMIIFFSFFHHLLLNITVVIFSVLAAVELHKLFSENIKMPPIWQSYLKIIIKNNTKDNRDQKRKKRRIKNRKTSFTPFHHLNSYSHIEEVYKRLPNSSFFLKLSKNLVGNDEVRRNTLNILVFVEGVSQLQSLTGQIDIVDDHLVFCDIHDLGML